MNVTLWIGQKMQKMDVFFIVTGISHNEEWSSHNED